MDKRTRAVWSGLAVVLGCAALIALSVYLFWPLTDMIAEHDVTGVAAADRAKELRLARDAARGRIIQVVLGILAVGGFVYTARNFTLARQQSELNRRTLELATLQAREQTEATRRTLEQSESAQMTDRFMRAIDQLGSDAVDIRLGGIHSLERIAQDSARDHPAVMEALAAFVWRTSRSRGNPVPVPPDAHGRPGPSRSRDDQIAVRYDARTQLANGDPPQDLQAAMTVLVRRSADADRGRVKLSGARLDGLDLMDANLAGADLSGATLTGADLRGADLTGASLAGADLKGARLGGARLDEARLERALLRAADLTDAGVERADLTGADLGGACLRRARCAAATAGGARLSGADLREATLTDADLTGADLTGANLEDAELTGAVLARAVLTAARADRAVLPEAVLSDAVASDASLRRADLTGATLTDANLSGAHLDGARLDGVDLTVVKLMGLDLTGAVAGDGARLPSGWHREPDGRLTRHRT